MKLLVLSCLLTFLVHLPVSAVPGDVSNESLAEAWGVVSPEEIAEIENSQNEKHHHHHHHHHEKE